MTSKMKDCKYCNQLFDMALDNGVVTEQDRGRFMESDTNALIDSEWIEIICDLDNSGFAGYVLKTMAFEYDIFCVDTFYQRKTTTKPTTDRIKEVFEEWLWNESGYTKEENDTVVITSGVNKGKQWKFNRVEWAECQQKTALQQEPIFDVFDANGVSLTTYTRSTFNGTKIFGYKHSTSGVLDSVLGFPPKLS